ncbi:MAG: BMP family ABC transporter substrate-binding protein [Saccharofermentans sp.]|nr:BMP family ABC transporter substrate-binding protein [Saccharofermentans sp.]
MASTLDEYNRACKLGKKTVQKALSDGRYPYLHALDNMIDSRTSMTEIKVGTMEIPLDLVAGTVTKGRQESFARNFMPILGPETEFGTKWILLYNYQMEKGISDAIKVIEFMGKFYVVEGNKRVSVLKYLEQPTILADVTRILPPMSDDPEVKIYFEFLEFYKSSQIYNIKFSEEGSYEKLAEEMGLTLGEQWDEDTIMDLKSAYLNFSKAYTAGGGNAFSITIGDAFLVYIGMYRYKSLVGALPEEIKKNLSQIWQEIRIRANANQITFSEEPTLQKKTVIPIIDTIMKKTYSEQHPLKIFFLYNGEIAKSRWINGHEQGRLELERKYPGIIRTLAADCLPTEEEFDNAVDSAARDGADMIITTSPIQMEHALRAAVKYPNIKFLNCSVHLAHSAVRTYYGRMYEAKFLLGVLAASIAKDHRIGYVSTYPICGNIANINAFAIGASMVDPEAKIYLTWSCLKDEYWREYIKENDLKIVSGPDLIRPTNADNEYGLYSRNDDGTITNIAFPKWNWGRYYDLIVQTVLNGAWDAEVADAKDRAINYWWGMTSGVIDISQCDIIPYCTAKLISAMKKSITSDVCNPFDGELRSQFGIIKPEDSPRLTNEEIINMNWLNDNVVGSIPRFEELTEAAQETVKANGMPIVGRGETGIA